MSLEKLSSPERLATMRIVQARCLKMQLGAERLDPFDQTQAAKKQQAGFVDSTQALEQETPKPNGIGQMAVETEANSATDARLLVQQAHVEAENKVETDDEEYDLAY